jgi:hypothetical protein
MIEVLFEPAKGPEFDANGYNYPGQWPTNRCQRFFDDKRTNTPLPVDRPTRFPTATYPPVDRPILGYTAIEGMRGATRLDYISDRDDSPTSLVVTSSAKMPTAAIFPEVLFRVAMQIMEVVLRLRIPC